MVCDECYSVCKVMVKKGRKMVCEDCDGDQRAMLRAVAKKRDNEVLVNIGRREQWRTGGTK